MTHLSFLSKSVSADMHLNHKIQKVVAIPTSTKIAIIEDESEEDAESDSSEEVNEKRELTVEEMCKQIVDQVVNVLFEAHDTTVLSKYGIVDNNAIK